MRVALSIIAIASNNEKPRPMRVHPAIPDSAAASGIFAARPGRPRTARMAATAARPPIPIVAVAARQVIKISSPAVIAGIAGCGYIVAGTSVALRCSLRR